MWVVVNFVADQSIFLHPSGLDASEADGNNLLSHRRVFDQRPERPVPTDVLKHSLSTYPIMLVLAVHDS